MSAQLSQHSYLTPTYGFSEAFWRQHGALSLPQQYLVNEGVVDLHNDFMLCMFAAYGGRLKSFLKANPRLQTLARLIVGDAWEIVLIKERYSFTIAHEREQLVLDGVLWHQVH